MMYCKKSSKWAMAKYLMILPVTSIAVAAMARPELTTMVESKVDQIAEGKVSNFIPIEQEKPVKKIVVKTDAGNNDSEQPQTTIVIKEETNLASSPKEFHIIVDGKEISTDEWKKFNPENISSIQIIKTDEELKKIGINDGKGAICILTKKTVEDVTKKVKKSVFEVVEKMPEFPGGHEAMLDYLTSNLHYPESAIKNKIEGRVLIRFTVKNDGTIEDVNVVRSVCPELDGEAIRIVSNMPAWIPGKLNGQNVNVSFVVPVSFKL